MPFKVTDLLSIFASEGYILWLHDRPKMNTGSREVLVVLKKGCTALDQLKAWMHALLLVHRANSTAIAVAVAPKTNKSYADSRLDELYITLGSRRHLFDQHISALTSQGWDLNVAALETRAGVRALIEMEKTPSAEKSTT